MNYYKKIVPVLLFFLFVIILFFFNVLFGTKTLLSYGQNMYPDKSVDQPYLKNTVQDAFAPSWIDVPYSALNNTFFKKLTLPLWNQYSAIGYPLAADMESSAFFPLHIPSLLGISSWDTYIIFRIMLSMVFLYLFLKEIKLDTIPSILGAFLYSFSGYFAYYINNFILNVDMLLPVGLFFIFKLSKKNSLSNIVCVICTFFLILNAGNPQSALLGLLFIDLYFLYLVLTENRIIQEKIANITNLLLINLISLGLSAYNYLLFWELYKDSWTIHPSGIALKHMDLIAMGNFVFPYLIGYLGGETFHNILTTRILPYFGILPVWLLLVGFLNRKYRKHVLFLLTILTFWFLKLIGFSFLNPLFQLPILTHIWFNKYTSTLFLSASILAAIGAHTLMSFIGLQTSKKIKNNLVLIAPLILALAIFVLLQIVGSYIGLDTSAKELMPLFINTIDTLFKSPHLREIGSEFFRWERIISLLTILFSIVVLVRPSKKYKALLITLFSLTLLFSVIVESYLYFPKIRSNKFNPAKKFPYVDFLKKDKSLFRIYGTEQTAIPQENLFFGISDIRIVSPLLYSRYASFFRELLISQPSSDYYPYLGSKDLTMNIVNNNLLSLLNVKYILSNNYFPSLSSYSLVYDHELKIYINKKVVPRVFLVNRVHSASDKKKIFSYLRSNSFLPYEEAVVEDPKKEIVFDPYENGGRASATVTLYESDKVSIDTVSTSTKLLVLSDLYYPGWKVFVDGKEGKIYPANYIMRGVILKKGHHTVEFIYRPNSFKVGVIISLMTLCLTVLFIKIDVFKFKND